LFLLTGTAFARARAGAQRRDPGHLVSPTSGAKGAVTRQQFESAFETSAALPCGRRRGGPFRRLSTLLAAGRGRSGNAWVRKRVIAVLGALSQNACRLPLAKVPIWSGPAAARWSLQASVACQADSQGRIVRKPPNGLRPTVTEEFYLVPAPRPWARQCDADNAISRKNRQVLLLSQAFAAGANTLASGANPAVRPAQGAIQAMVAREFPALVVTLTDGGK
jgi:hypothetical protein